MPFPDSRFLHTRKSHSRTVAQHFHSGERKLLDLPSRFENGFAYLSMPDRQLTIQTIILFVM